MGMNEYRLFSHAKAGNVEEVKKCVSKPNININYTNTHGQTPLWIATKAGFVGVVEVLLKAEAEVDHVDKKGGNTALHIASERGDRSIVMLLLMAKAKSFKNKAGLIPRDLVDPTDKALRKIMKEAETVEDTSKPIGLSKATPQPGIVSNNKDQPIVINIDSDDDTSSLPPHPVSSPPPISPPLPISPLPPVSPPPPIPPPLPPPENMILSNKRPTIQPDRPAISKPRTIEGGLNVDAEEEEGASRPVNREQTADRRRKTQTLLLNKSWKYPALVRPVATGPMSSLESEGVIMIGRGGGGCKYWCGLCGVGLADKDRAVSHVATGGHQEGCLRDRVMSASQGQNLQFLNNLTKTFSDRISPLANEIEGLKVAMATCQALLRKSKVFEASGYTIQDIKCAGKLARGTVLRGENVCEILTIVDKLPHQFLTTKLVQSLRTHLVAGQAVRVYGPFSFVVQIGTSTVIVLLASEPYMKGPPHEDTVLREQRAEGRRLAAFNYFKNEAKEIHGDKGVDVLISLVRILCILQRKEPFYPSWDCLKPWTLELLAAYTVLTSDRHLLSLSQSLRSVMDQVASGMLLPGGQLLADPCDERGDVMAGYLHPQGCEEVTAAGQDASRAINQGKRDILEQWLGAFPHTTGGLTPRPNTVPLALYDIISLTSSMTFLSFPPIHSSKPSLTLEHDLLHAELVLTL
eukprot:Ihof_evm4s234 gene=Ihof_evmTU4s234